MTQQELEEAVLANMDSLESYVTVKGAKVSSESFTFFPQVFSFIEDYVRESGGKTLPSKELLQKQFSVSLPEARDRDFYVKELLERELGRKTQGVLEIGINLLVEEQKPSEAVNYLLASLAKLRKQTRITRSVTDQNALERLDHFLEKQEKERQGIKIGLRTGLSFFDEEQLGLTPGNFLGIMGNTNVGKSWLLQYISSVMYVDGARVLFISPEMSVEEVEARWDTLVGRLFGVELSNMGIMRGRGVNVAAYREFLEKVKERKDWLTCCASDVGNSFTVGGIEDLALQFKPDVVALDGIPLIGLDGKASKTEVWQRVSEVSYTLKNMAEAHGFVVMATNQATRETELKEDVHLKDIGYSYAFAQACDRVLAISAPREPERQEHERLVRLIKARVGSKSSQVVHINWDVDKGIIGT